jgi:stage III sporulation protein SpoIIIAA
MHVHITDDLELMVDVLPPAIAEALRKVNRGEELLEIVMDLGRPPEARFTTGEVTLSDKEITETELDFVVSRIGDFGEDNRAGIPRTLHRISAIRNRKGRIVGLTCRVGRAVFGTVDIIRDIVESGQSILLLGRPGVGKTTMLREVARILAEKKRVVIVDTSNEIGGDGDIPHPAIGRARRMQVPTPMLQHEVMIEAVENHMPEVIIIDEIGRELEAVAARTIAERGVQLVGTAHGNTLDNIMLNPTLADLAGGIQTVTLSDEEARRRGTQKSVLERKAPPTFDVVVEIQDWNHLAVHHDVARAVDAILRGRQMPAELRYRDESGEVRKEEAMLTAPPTERPLDVSEFQISRAARSTVSRVNIYPYGVSQNRLRQAATALQLPINLVDNVHDADAVMTLKSYYRKRPQPISDAERLGVPVYVLRSNTVNQIENCLVDVFGLEVRPDPFVLAMNETQQAIDEIMRGRRDMIELSPQNAYIRRHQHEMARAANLHSQSQGKEPRRRVRIYRNTISG